MIFFSNSNSFSLFFFSLYISPSSIPKSLIPRRKISKSFSISLPLSLSDKFACLTAVFLQKFAVFWVGIKKKFIESRAFFAPIFSFTIITYTRLVLKGVLNMHYMLYFFFFQNFAKCVVFYRQCKKEKKDLWNFFKGEVPKKPFFCALTHSA